MSYQIQADIEQMRQTVQAMRTFSELLHDNRKRLDQKVTGFLSDLFRGNLQSMFETAITTLNPEVWKLSGTMDDLAQRLEQLAQRIEDADKSLRMEYLGKTIPPRIYIINGISSDILSSENVADPSSIALETLIEQHSNYDPKDVVATHAIYTKENSEESDNTQRFRNSKEVYKEYTDGDQGQYTKKTFEFIENDINQNPLIPGQEILLIGYSGGGAVAPNLPEMINKKLGYNVSGIMTLGSPVVDINRAVENTEKLVMVQEDSDPVVHNILAEKFLENQSKHNDPKVVYRPIGNEESEHSSHGTYPHSINTVKIIKEQFNDTKEHITVEDDID